MKKIIMSLVCVMLLAAGSASANLTTEEYENALDMANLSARVYDALWDSALDTIAPYLFPTIDFEGNTANYLVVQEFTDGWDGFDAKLYINTDNNKYVLVFRGTQPLSPIDWMHDLAQVLNDYIDMDISQYEKAVDLAVALQSQLGDNLQITGHSLGGGLAQVAGLYTGLKTTCFEAAGTTSGTLYDLGITYDMIDSANITHFNVQYDPLSDYDGDMNNEAPFYNTLQYGATTYWLDNITGTGGTWNSMRVINHFYHAFVYQLTYYNFY
ncbi:MAG: DUF2974 domain-containing protein [Desulfobacteraceae bacterium]|nr:DUF2974 domain-containing protein [Desulfobacteraceae bacterium]